MPATVVVFIPRRLGGKMYRMFKNGIARKCRLFKTIAGIGFTSVQKTSHP